MPSPFPALSLPALTLPAAPAVVAQGFAPSEPFGCDALPLQGVTVLAVEDSRYASEALRLICARSGARLRRAETLAAARAHLRVYRPDVVIVDLGLPDGRGEGLIRDLVQGRPRPPVVLGSSGDALGRGAALAAGAQGFLEKPVESLAGFCDCLLAHLSDREDPGRPLAQGCVEPDRLALREDLAAAAQLLRSTPDARMQRYLAGFVTGIARHSHDDALAKAAARMLDPGGPADLVCLRQLLDDRLALTSPRLF